MERYSVACLAPLSCGGARNRGRTGMPLMQEAADFKSDVSTNFTIRAGMGNEDNPKQNSPDNDGWRGL